MYIKTSDSTSEPKADKIAQPFTETEDTDRAAPPPPTYHGGPVMKTPGIVKIKAKKSTQIFCFKPHVDHLMIFKSFNSNVDVQLKTSRKE